MLCNQYYTFGRCRKIYYSMVFLGRNLWTSFLDPLLKFSSIWNQVTIQGLDLTGKAQNSLPDLLVVEQIQFLEAVGLKTSVTYSLAPSPHRLPPFCVPFHSTTVDFLKGNRRAFSSLDLPVFWIQSPLLKGSLTRWGLTRTIFLYNELNKDH